MFQRGRPVRRVIGIGKKRLAQAVRDGGYDLVLCCHVFAGMMLADAVEKYALPCKTALIETDYTASPGSEFCGDLLHFVPTESVKEALIRRGVPAGKITVSGIPVRQSFYGEISRQEAKARLGISGEQMHLLIMCGSMGCGPIESVLDELKEPAKGPPTVSVVCGNNSRLYRRLSERYRANDSIRVYGQCEDIPLLMDSAELYLTKPGGLSVTEAAAKGLPMVLVDLVAGCEAHNLSLFTSSRSAVSGKTASELARLCLSLLADPDKRERMSGSLKRLVHIRSAEAVLTEMSALPIPARLPTNAEYCTGGSDCHAGIGADSADRRLLLFWPAYFLSFFLLELSSKGRELHLVHCALDDRIPFCEWFFSLLSLACPDYSHGDLYPASGSPDLPAAHAVFHILLLHNADGLHALAYLSGIAACRLSEGKRADMGSFSHLSLRYAHQCLPLFAHHWGSGSVVCFERASAVFRTGLESGLERHRAADLPVHGIFKAAFPGGRCSGAAGELSVPSVQFPIQIRGSERQADKDNRHKA